MRGECTVSVTLEVGDDRYQTNTSFELAHDLAPFVGAMFGGPVGGVAGAVYTYYGPKDWHHAFIVTADPITGEKTVYEGGPPNGEHELHGVFPHPLAQNSVKLDAYRHSRKVVWDDSGSCAEINHSFERTGGEIDALRLDYHWWSTNSNAYASTLLNRAGLPVKKPGGWTPAWGHIIDVP